MEKRAVLLVNLGSPDSPDVPDVRRYLREFLSDPLVLDAPWLVRMLLLYGFILPFRPKASAHAYRQIWSEAGSPLIVHSEALARALEARIEPAVALAMRYGSPSIADVLEGLLREEVAEIFLVPLYPHYAMSSYETVVREVRDRLAGRAKLRIQPPFYAEPSYLQALARACQERLEEPYDLLLISFHGIPEHQVRKRDASGCYCLSLPGCCEQEHPARSMCYRAQCLATAAGLARELGLERGRWRVSFQSRLGRRPWLKPYTDLLLAELPRQGVRRLRVVCPSFVSDCLETLEEIHIRGRETFLAAGGESFEAIPCLNEHPLWIDTLVEFVRRWQEAPPSLFPSF